MNEQQPTQSPPSNYLVFAILTTIFCCWVFGIISIIYAAQVNSKWYAGDYKGAINSSQNAKTWAWVAFTIGILTGIVGIILALLGVFAGIGAGTGMFNL